MYSSAPRFSGTEMVTFQTALQRLTLREYLRPISFQINKSSHVRLSLFCGRAVANTLIMNETRE